MCIHKTSKINDHFSPTVLSGTKLNIDWDQCDYVDCNELNELDIRAQDLNIIQYNVRGILSKQDDLHDLLTNMLDGKIHVVILCETWLTSSNKSRLNIPGYTYIGTERANKKGGGVGFLLKDDLKFRKRTDLQLSNSLLENDWVELKCNTDNVLIGSLYRPPNTNEKQFLTAYNKITKTLNKYNGNTILGMDHNLDFLKLDKHKATGEFLELNLDNNLLPCITRPTRITKSSATLIDNIFINLKLHEDCRTSIITIDLSDHLPCLLTVPDIYTTKKVMMKTSRKFTDKNVSHIISDVSSINWNTKLNVKSSNDSFTEFHKTLTDTIDRHAPPRTVMIRTKKKPNPWITKGTINSCQRLRTSYSKTLLPNCPEIDKENYKTHRNLLTRLKRRSKMLYYQNLCLDYRNNSKKLWQIINEVSGKIKDKSSVIECLKINNIRTYSSSKITNEFGNYFSKVGNQFASKIKKPTHADTHYLNKISSIQKSVFLIPVTETEIEKIIMSLPNKPSSGSDGISNILLKRLKNCIIHPLTLIFNKSITEGEFPDIMKVADVVPLYKSKSPMETTNYRPISLLLTISKILEKVIYKRIYSFLNDNHQLYDSQYGFRAKHSCEDAVNELLSNIVKANTQKKKTIAIFLDLSKAFDTLSHELLLKKLDLYGIRGTAHKWFKSYLHGRKLRTKCVNNTGQLKYSDYYDITYGTPQGSCLGPLLFLIFCNDIFLHLESCKCILFADDTTLYYSHKNIDYLKWCIEQDLKIIADWFRANKLTLNIVKSDCILFGARASSNLKLELDGELLPFVKSTKFLGVWIDENLTWTKHVTELTVKLKRGQKLLQLSRNFLSPHALQNLYYAQFHSHLSYGIITWGNMISKGLLTTLQKLQNTCLSYLKLKHCRIPDVTELIKLVNCKLGYRLTNKLLPIKIAEAFATDAHNKSLLKNHRYNTRNKLIPNIPSSKDKKYHDCYLVASLTDFQTLPAVTRELPNIHRFYKECKKIICRDKQ